GVVAVELGYELGNARRVVADEFALLRVLLKRDDHVAEHQLLGVLAGEVEKLQVRGDLVVVEAETTVRHGGQQFADEVVSGLGPPLSEQTQEVPLQASGRLIGEFQLALAHGYQRLDDREPMVDPLGDLCAIGLRYAEDSAHDRERDGAGVRAGEVESAQRLELVEQVMTDSFD